MGDEQVAISTTSLTLVAPSGPRRQSCSDGRERNAHETRPRLRSCGVLFKKEAFLGCVIDPHNFAYEASHTPLSQRKSAPRRLLSAFAFICFPYQNQAAHLISVTVQTAFIPHLSTTHQTASLSNPPFFSSRPPPVVLLSPPFPHHSPPPTPTAASLCSSPHSLAPHLAWTFVNHGLLSSKYFGSHIFPQHPTLLSQCPRQLLLPMTPLFSRSQSVSLMQSKHSNHLPIQLKPSLMSRHFASGRLTSQSLRIQSLYLKQLLSNHFISHPILLKMQVLPQT